MSSTQSFAITTNYGDGKNHYDSVNGMLLDYSDSISGEVAIIAPLGKTDHCGAVLKDDVKDLLFPNSLVHPTKIAIEYRAMRSGTSSSLDPLAFVIGGTTVHTKTLPNYSYTTYSAEFTASDVPAVASCTRSTEIKWDIDRGTLTSQEVQWATITTYFTRYDFTASKGTGISAATVSSATGYDGDAITFTATAASGYRFTGWYKGSTRVSTSQTYTHTVNGADLSLQAQAEPSTALYVKQDGAWTQVGTIYKKSSSKWSTTTIDDIDPDANYVKKG